MPKCVLAVNGASSKVPYKALLILGLTATCCTAPLFIFQSLPLSHDIIFHVFNIEQFNRALSEGSFLPRWTADANNGYGSASFIFYAPLSYYLASGIKFLIPSLTLSMAVVIWLGFFLSGASMLLAVKKIFGTSNNLLPAVIYQLFPFHIMDLYMRGAFAELMAFVWFPLIILFMHKIFVSRSDTAALGLCISYAALIVTHLVSGFIFTVVALAYLVYNYFWMKDKIALLKALFALMLGIGLSSFYLVPVIFEQRFVQIDYITGFSVGDYRNNFLFMWDDSNAKFRLFYQALHITVIMEGILFLLLIFLVRENKRRVLSGQRGFLITLFLFALFLTTPLSRPLWAIIPEFPSLQFPWRWISVMELSLCLLIGSVLSVGAIDFKSKNIKSRASIYLMVVVLGISLVVILKHKTLPVRFMKTISSPEQFKFIMYPPIEYTPIGAVSLEKMLDEERTEKASVLSGEAFSQVVEWKAEKRVINVKASTPSLLRIATFYFPGWEAWIDERKADITLEKKTGAMMVNIPEGAHILTLRFVDTSTRYYAKLISLGFIGVICFLLISAKRANVVR